MQVMGITEDVFVVLQIKTTTLFHMMQQPTKKQVGYTH
jgi:hypothetical protein